MNSRSESPNPKERHTLGYPGEPASLQTERNRLTPSSIQQKMLGIQTFMDIKDQLQKQNLLTPVIFTQDTPDLISSSAMKKQFKTKVEQRLNQSRPSSSLKQNQEDLQITNNNEDFQEEKKKLIMEMDKLEQLDKVNPLQMNMIHKLRQKQFQKETDGVKRQIEEINQRKSILKKQAEEFEDFQQVDRVSQLFKVQTDHENQFPKREKVSFRQSDMGVYDPILESQLTEQVKEEQVKQSSHFKRFALTRQGVIDLDKDNPNNMIEFDKQDFQYLKKTKIKQLRDAQEDLQKAKQNENREHLQLTGELAFKWERVRRKIRMIGKMKMIFDEVKMYGTSFRVETSEKRKEVIQELETILAQRLNKIEDNKKQKQKLGYLLLPESSVKLYWQFVLVFLMLYTSFVTPLRLTFIEDDSPGWMGVEYTVDILFLIDILMTFNSAYYDEMNELIVSRRKIFLNYLKSWLFLDVLAIFPFDFVTSTDNNQQYNGAEDYFKLTRLPRLYRLIKLARVVKMFKSARTSRYVEKFQDYLELNAGMRRVVAFLSTVIICVHIMGCFWYFAAKIQDFQEQTWVYENGLADKDKFSIYVASIYWTVQTISTVGFGDIHAYNDLERILSCIWMLLGAGFYTFTVGSLANILAELDTKTTHLQNKITVSDEFCRETNLSKQIRDKIRRNLEYTSMKSIFSKKQREEFLMEVPLYLKFNIAEAMHENLQFKVPFFRDKEQLFIASLVTILQPSRVAMGEIIYQKGEHPNIVYFLVNGRVNMVIGMHQITFKTYVQGSYFGEVEIFDASPRLHTARAEVDCHMLTIDYKEFLEILKLFPDYYQEVRTTSLEKLKKENQAIQSMQIIANLSFRSKFWSKSRSQNLYQIVKERQDAELVERADSESIERKGPQSLNSKHTGKSKYSNFTSKAKMYQEYQKRLARKGSGLVPLDYKHSLIPNLEQDYSSGIPKLTTLNKDHTLYVESFAIPEHIQKENSNKFIEIRVSKYKGEDSLQSAHDSGQLKGNQDTEVIKKQLNEFEFLTFSEKNLSVPKSRLVTSVGVGLEEYDKKIKKETKRRNNETTLKDKIQTVISMHREEEKTAMLHNLFNNQNQETKGNKNEMDPIYDSIQQQVNYNEIKIQNLNQQLDLVLEKLKDLRLRQKVQKQDQNSISQAGNIPNIKLIQQEQIEQIDLRLQNTSPSQSKERQDTLKSTKNQDYINAQEQYQGEEDEDYLYNIAPVTQSTKDFEDNLISLKRTGITNFKKKIKQQKQKPDIGKKLQELMCNLNGGKKPYMDLRQNKQTPLQTPLKSQEVSKDSKKSQSDISV